MVVVVEVGSEGGRPGESPPHALLIRLDFCQRCAGDSSPRDIVMFRSFGMSIDGHGAGPTQSLENPLGVGGLAPTNGSSKRALFTLRWARTVGKQALTMTRARLRQHRSVYKALAGGWQSVPLQ